jgi:hypothetical protein
MKILEKLNTFKGPEYYTTEKLFTSLVTKYIIIYTKIRWTVRNIKGIK